MEDAGGVSPGDVMTLLERFLPFAVRTFTERREVFRRPGYEPGLRESNFAVVLAETAMGGPSGDCPYGRDQLVRLAAEALSDLEGYAWPSVSPLAWSYVAYALVLLRGLLDGKLSRELTDRVARWADRLLDYDFPTGLYRDTKAEETCWTAGPLVGAQALLPEDPRRAAWQEKADRFFLNSYNREEDLWDDAVVEGKPVRDRVCTANVFPDFTVENHDSFHPAYQACFNNYAIPYILYKKTLGRVPETLLWNWKSLHGVMARLFSRDGRIFCPAGNDYHPVCHCGQAHYLAIVADALGDPMALWALRKALRNTALVQRGNDGRLVGRFLMNEDHVYWEFHFASFLAFAHALAPFGGMSSCGDGEALAQGGGPWVSPYIGVLVHKGRKLHAGCSLRTVAGRAPGVGFVVPQGGAHWTDYFCARPQLSPDVRTAEGTEVRLEPTDSILGASQAEAWSLGAWADRDVRIRRTSAFLSHEEGVLQVDRLMRYGEQVPIFGSDMELSRPRAEGPEYRPWTVRTLNYRAVNEEPDFRPFRVQDAEGVRELERGEADWTCGGDWVLLDGRMGLVRLWGGGAWRFSYRRETEPLHPGHYWKHDAWALNVFFQDEAPPPRGYGLMAGHAVMFVPVGDAGTLEDLARGGRAAVEENRGDFLFRVQWNGWNAAHVLRLGHLLEFC